MPRAEERQAKATGCTVRLSLRELIRGLRPLLSVPLTEWYAELRQQREDLTTSLYARQDRSVTAG
jgi:hypothetical protein